MTKTFNIVEIINGIGEEVESVLETRNKEKYFEEIMLLYSLVENLLKWLIFMKAIWGRTQKGVDISQKAYLGAWGKLEDFCRNLSFYYALNIGLALDAIDPTLYKKLDQVRKERNDISHQLWILSKRQNKLVLRKNLEKLANVTKQLCQVTQQLTDQMGVEEIYTFKLG